MSPNDKRTSDEVPYLLPLATLFKPLTNLSELIHSRWQYVFIGPFTGIYQILGSRERNEQIVREIAW